MPRRNVNTNNGSNYFTLKELISKFYKSKFNRDNCHDLGKNEDINNSARYRLYAKSDIAEIIQNFAEYIEWAIVEENIGRVCFTKDIRLARKSKLPVIKTANKLGQRLTNGRSSAGEQFVTHGKYIWRLEITGELRKRLKEVENNDPEIKARREELQKEVEERNKNEKAKRGDSATT